MCEQKPYPVQFSCQRKSYTEESEHSLIFNGNLCTVVQREIEDSTYGHFFWKGKRGVLSLEMCKWRMAMLHNYQEQPIKEKLNVLLLPTHCRNEFHY